VKKIVTALLLFLLLVPSISSGEELYQHELNRGIRNSEAYSFLLIEQAKRTAGAQKINILREAMDYSPDLPAVYFELAKASFGLAPEAVFQTIDYMLQGIAAYQRNFWSIFMLTASLFMSAVISFFIAVSLMVVVRLPRDVPLLSHDVKEDRISALLLLVLLFAVFGPLYLPAALLMIISLYMKKWDRLVIYLYLIFLLASPLIFRSISTAFMAPSSGDLKAIVQVNESKGNRYALSVLRGEDPVVLFSYALALKREGKYHEAIDIYNKLIAIKPDPRLYNNLANCYIALNDVERAKMLYRKSIEQNPLPVALYNLSEAYRETLDFEKGEEYFLAAQKMDGDAVSRFRAIFGRNPNRFVIDEGLPMSDLWRYAEAKTTESSTLGLSVLPLPFIPIIAVLMAALFYALTRQARPRAYRCNRCGAVFCSRCEKHILWGHMCLQCYRSLVKLDELDAKERITRILTVYGYQKKRRDIIKVISFILPGSGQIYAGNVLTGFLFLWPFLFFLLIPVMNSLFVMEMTGFSNFWLDTAALFFAAVVYFISVMTTRRRLVRGWL
jgi:tetratricopeptide (TPR) repeat protein